MAATLTAIEGNCDYVEVGHNIQNSWQTIVLIRLYGLFGAARTLSLEARVITGPIHEYRWNCSGSYTETATPPSTMRMEIIYTDSTHWNISYLIDDIEIYNEDYVVSSGAVATSVELFLFACNGLYFGFACNYDGSTYGVLENLIVEGYGYSNEWGWDSEDELDDWSDDPGSGFFYPFVIDSKIIPDNEGVGGNIYRCGIYNEEFLGKNYGVSITNFSDSLSFLYYSLIDGSPSKQIYSSPLDDWPLTKISKAVGRTFPESIIPGMINTVVYSSFEKFGILYVFYNDGSNNIYYSKSKDGGVSYQYGDTTVNATAAYAFLLNNRGVIGLVGVGGGGAATFYVSHNGETFSVISEITTGANPSANLCAVQVHGKIYVYLYKSSILYLYSSIDGGQTWTSSAIT